MKLVSTSPATLFIDDVAVGCCQVNITEPVRPEPLDFSGALSFSWSGRLAWRNSKKARRDKRAWRELLEMSPANHRYVRLYRQVKQHQLRKRQLAKRR